MTERTFYTLFVRDLFKHEPSDVLEQEEFLAMFGKLHAAVGLADEAAEVLGLLKKVIFTGKSFDREALVDELGDVEFYLQAIRNEFGIDRDDVLSRNIIKLESRHPSGNVEEYYEGDTTSPGPGHFSRRV